MSPHGPAAQSNWWLCTMRLCPNWANLRRSLPIRKDGKFISFYGDNHPVYAGNVVKAMASAKNGYPYVVKLFEQELASLNPAQQPERDAALKALFARLDDAFKASIVAINRLTPTIIEVVVKAPMQAEKFHPGQFYRVQNYEAFAPDSGRHSAGRGRLGADRR